MRYTYFALLHGSPKFIKIGQSSNPENRVSALDSNNPHLVTLLGYIEGAHWEKHLLDALQDSIYWGEWLIYSVDILVLVVRLLNKKEHPNEIIKEWRKERRRIKMDSIKSNLPFDLYYKQTLNFKEEGWIKP